MVHAKFSIWFRFDFIYLIFTTKAGPHLAQFREKRGFSLNPPEKSMKLSIASGENQSFSLQLCMVGSSLNMPSSHLQALFNLPKVSKYRELNYSWGEERCTLENSFEPFQKSRLLKVTGFDLACFDAYSMTGLLYETGFDRSYKN